MKHRFKLASNKVRKITCPYCGAAKHWQRYIDTKTGEVLPDEHGRCDNEVKCGAWVKPQDTGYAKMIWEQEKQNRLEFPKSWKPLRKPLSAPPEPKPAYFDFETFKKETLNPDNYEKNTFLQNLFYNVPYPFKVEDVTRVVELYWLGTIASGYRAGAVTFPFIDVNGNIRAVQVKQFNESNHTIGTDFLHSILTKKYTGENIPLPDWLEAYNKQEKIISCLFGEHLLKKYPANPVALVEAPKTAIYGWLYFNQSNVKIYKDCIWLAVYNKSSFTFDKLRVLQGRFVYVMPDLSKDGSTFREWKAKAKEYEIRLPGTKFIMDDLLEKIATPELREDGSDIADVLIQMDWNKFPFRTCKSVVSEASEAPKNNFFSHAIKLTKPEPEPEPSNPQTHDEPLIDLPEPIQPKKENWDDIISELEVFFAGVALPNQPIKLNDYTTITNCALFVESHIETLKRNNGNHNFLPFLDRLKQLKDKIENTDPYLLNVPEVAPF